MKIDYIDFCSRVAHDTFQVLDDSKYPKEYHYGLNTYTMLLLACCCFRLIDSGESEEIIYEVERFYKNKLPFSFTVWAKRIYKIDLESRNTTYEDRDELDGFRMYLGNEIGKYFFEDYLYTIHYDILKTSLSDSISNVLHYLDNVVLDID